MKKLLFGLVLLVTSGLQAAESQALQDERAGQQNSSQAIKKFTRQEVGIKKEDNGSVSLRFVAAEHTILVLADLVGQCSYLKDMFEIFAQDTKEETAHLNLTAEAVNLLINLWGKAKTVEAFIQELPGYSFAQLVDLWMAIETLGFEYDLKQTTVADHLQAKIGPDFLRLIVQVEPIDPILLGKIQVTMLRDYLIEQLYKNGFKLKYTLQGHTNIVTSVAFSPNGQLIVTSSDDKTAKLWDTQTGQCLHTLEGHTQFVYSVVFSPDGQLVATASGDQTAKVWNVETGQCLHTLQGHDDWINSVAFSPNGQLIVTSSDDKTARLWNVQTGECLRTFQGHTNIVTSVAFSPNGQLIVTGSFDDTAKLWNVQTGQCLRTLEGHVNNVNSVAFSPNGQLIVTGSFDGTAKLWNVQTGECVGTLERHTLAINSVAFSPDGQLIVTASADRTAKIWNVQTGACLRTLEGHTHAVYSVAFSPDGASIVTGSFDDTAKLWRNNFAQAGIRSLGQALQLSIDNAVHVFKTGQMPVKKIPAAESKQ